jgi:uncharacterized protein (DUF2252 family)
MTATRIAHPSLADRRARGVDARTATPPESHAGWVPVKDRRDPVALLEEQNTTREPDLVPVRHGRMVVSPFTFYRGAAKIMAADLAGTPTSGLDVQLCGDAHLSNFGAFASPERRLLFDLNDFDETLPGPFEYDVKRMAASFTIAARNNGLTKAEGRSVTGASVRAYREAMAQFAGMRTMDLWYAHVSEDDLRAAVARLVTPTGHGKKKDGKSGKGGKGKGGKASHNGGRGGKDAAAELARAAKQGDKTLRKAHTRDSLQALSKLGELVDGRYRIVSQPPVVVPARDLAATYGMSEDEIETTVHDQFREYRATLQDDRRHLLERFEIVDMARKVVGVGSVGTRAFIVLLQGRDPQDPLFLQIKEATRSVLEDHLPKSRYRNPGERVVQGQRMMQAASDIYLGWTKGVQEDRHYYWRQLRDMKASAVVDTMSAAVLELYAGLCGWTLARAHARSGDAVAIAEYLGGDEAFDTSITDFSQRYADQNEQDYQALVAAIGSGRVPAVEGI